MQIDKNKPRRTFIKAGVWAFALTMIAPVRTWGSDKKPYLLRVFKNEQTVRTIGRKYLQQYPREKGPLKQLLSGIDDMHKQATQEFETSRCVTIDGWVLAQSEARECAWYYLKHSGHAH